MKKKKLTPVELALARAEKKRAEEQQQLVQPVPEEMIDDDSIKGFGDLIKKGTQLLGIKQCDACKERQAKLNKMFPFIKRAKPLNDDDIKFLKRIRHANTIGAEDRNEIFYLSNRTFGVRLTPCQCPSTIIQLREKLWNLYLAEYSQNIDEI
ncbi:hypothetical protein ACFPVY_03885 [Flavobacterium qiangtangense]|uniref:Uncharacterized protein n=1 Tax=Flavobacterium qiangtangense TaxID=1442595 RepID=A0ABW1PKW3_9FLAO